MAKLIDFEITKNITGSISLLIVNEDGGHRLSGSKVGGCDSIKTFTVEVSELLAVINEYAYEPKEGR